MARLTDHPPTGIVRARLRVAGTVQGVGFRPFVYRIATRLGLSGWARNTSGGVDIEVEGDPDSIDRFERALTDEAPPLSEVDRVTRRAADTGPEGRTGFEIVPSAGAGELAASIPPDVATCEHCLREVLDPGDRRHRYPFTNCVHCGPRLSVILGLPYDRPATTMARFTMCARCRAEYDDPADRRFHAQPNACPDCGPRLELWDPTGRAIAERDDALGAACDAIRDGRIVAVKGLGGYHLMADARQAVAVDQLRRRKRRPTKPFALMARSAEDAERWALVSDVERRALRSARAPIVLLRRRDDADVAEPVAPGSPFLGVMLPATPLHHLMLDDLGFPIVATSGNLTDEPICFDEPEALERLGGIADLLLVNDRPIARPVDDSIVQVIDGRARVMRRSRGFAPRPIRMPVAVRGGPILAVGAAQKATVGLARGDVATLSQHVGDLDTPAATEAHRRAAEDLQRMLRAPAARVARDAHPDYASSRLARATGLPQVEVRHHAAHVYSAMAEHGIGPGATVLGLSWDGAGLGDDGAVWGGELLRVRGARVRRVGHLRAFPLPGGDAAARRPALSAAGALFELFGPGAFDRDDLAPIAALGAPRRDAVRSMLERSVRCPMTTSAGRLFDAAASLLGLCHAATFEGEAAALLQGAAEVADAPAEPLPISASPGDPAIIDWGPTLIALAERRAGGDATERLALAFHRALAGAAARTILTAAGDEAPTVVLTGGCFQNRLLAELTVGRLADAGVRALLHERVPPNDGGVALGQLYGAAIGAGAEQGENG